MKQAFLFLILAVLLLAACLTVPDGQILWEVGDALYTGRSLPAFSFRVRPYGLCLALGALAAFGLSWALCGRKVGAPQALRFFALSLLLGLVFSRGLYCLCEGAYYQADWVRSGAALRFWDGGMSMTGALLGLGLAALIERPCREMAALSAPVAVLFARFGERYTQSLGLGMAVPFENFLTRQALFSSRLNVSLLEIALAAVILACVLASLRKGNEKGQKPFRALALFFLLYGVSQVLMESLRRDQHMIWGFTKAQQIFALLLAFFALAYAAPREKRFLCFLITLLAAALLVGLEFALDRADLPALLLYGAYLTVLSCYLFFALRLFRRGAFPLFKTE